LANDEQKMTSLLLILATALTTTSTTIAQPPGGGGGGMMMGTCSPDSTKNQVAATTCGTATKCSNDGSTNYIKYGLSSYTPDSNGRFSVSFTTNLCPNNAKTAYVGGVAPGANGFGGSTPCCMTVTLPVNTYVSATNAVATPLRNEVGFSLFGVKMFGPMEAGFSKGQACSNSLGSCDAGMDVTTCRAKLVKECGKTNVTEAMLPDDCKYLIYIYIHGTEI
jgi:hypothetical protein